MRAVRMLLVVATTVIAGQLATASAGWAHAELASSDPAEGAVLAAAPTQVRFTFSEGVAAGQSSVRLRDAALPLHQPAGQPTVLVADLAAVPAVSGDVALAWRSVSQDDGHAETGTLHFYIGTGAGAAPTGPGPTGPGPLVRTLTVAVRLVGYLALAVFLGGLLFVALLWPAGAGDRRTRRVLGVACLLGAVSAVAGIWVQAAYANLLPLGAALRPGPLGQVLDTPFGRAWAARTLLWLLAAIVFSGLLQRAERAPRSLGWRIGAVAVGIGLLRTTGMSGHAGDGTGGWWGAAVDIVHLAAVATWLGGLTVLLAGVLPRRRAAELATVVPRFSRFALGAVLVLAGTGTVLAVRLVGSWHALTHTRYGLLLIVKLALLGLVLAAAQRSKAWVGRRLDLAVVLRADAATVRPFVYSVAAETVLLLVVVSAASLLVTASPGR